MVPIVRTLEKEDFHAPSKIKHPVTVFKRCLHAPRILHVNRSADRWFKYGNMQLTELDESGTRTTRG